MYTAHLQLVTPQNTHVTYQRPFILSSLEDVLPHTSPFKLPVLDPNYPSVFDETDFQLAGDCRHIEDTILVTGTKIRVPEFYVQCYPRSSFGAVVYRDDTPTAGLPQEFFQHDDCTPIFLNSKHLKNENYRIPLSRAPFLLSKPEEQHARTICDIAGWLRLTDKVEFIRYGRKHFYTLRKPTVVADLLNEQYARMQMVEAHDLVIDDIATRIDERSYYAAYEKGTIDGH